MHAAMPSAADLIFLALLGVLVFTPLSAKLLGDAGTGWHIRTGQQIIATRAIPRVDSFSSTMQGKPWFAWEWLYDLIAGALDSAFGLNGVVWLTAVVIALVFAWLFRIVVKRGTNLTPAVILVLLAIAASMIHFLARPHVVSWLFTLAWFVILDGVERSRDRDRQPISRRWIWILPLLTAVWANVHGGFLVGFVLLGIYWLSAVWGWWHRASEGEGLLFEIFSSDPLARNAARAGEPEPGKRVWNLTIVGVLSVAAGMVNPYGWRLYGHIHQYLANRFLMDHIEEFQSPNFHGISQKCFAILLLIAVATLAMRGRQLRVSQLLTLLFAVYSGLYAARNIPTASVLVVAIVAPLLRERSGSRGFFRRMRALEIQARWHLWAIAGVIATFLIVMNGGKLGGDQIANARFDPQRMPVGAVDFVERQAVGGPILSMDYWGGYLIYRLYPKNLVVMDDRHDLYGEKFLKSYLKTIRVEQGWEEFLNAHEFSYAILPKKAALANAMIATGRWKSVYSDATAVVLSNHSAETTVSTGSRMDAGEIPIRRAHCARLLRAGCRSAKKNAALGMMQNLNLLHLLRRSEAVVGVDVEADDGFDFYGLVAAQGRLEFPGAQGGYDFGSHIGWARLENVQVAGIAGSIDEAGDDHTRAGQPGRKVFANRDWSGKIGAEGVSRTGFV